MKNFRPSPLGLRAFYAHPGVDDPSDTLHSLPIVGYQVCPHTGGIEAAVLAPTVGQVYGVLDDEITANEMILVTIAPDGQMPTPGEIERAVRRHAAHQRLQKRAA